MFKLVINYTNNVKEPWLNNENFKEKERKKFLIFVMICNRLFHPLYDSVSHACASVSARNRATAVMKYCRYTLNRQYI